jgi:exopolyphosphatase/pppGpp-phosphohydrolase
MDRLLAADLTVAGYGMREGLALSSLTDEPAPVASVQRAGVDALGSHFSSWDAATAERRAMLASRLLAAMQPELPEALPQAVDCAARLLDIGRSVDYYRRYAHAARIVADANLDGYSHRVLAFVAAGLLAAGEREASTRNYAPLLGAADQPAVEQLAATLALTEALVRYGQADLERVGVERRNGAVSVATPLIDQWPVEAPLKRAERAFGLRLSLAA